MSPFSASTVGLVLKHRWLLATCWPVGDHMDTEMDKESPDPALVDLTAQQGPWSGAGSRPGVHTCCVEPVVTLRGSRVER